MNYARLVVATLIATIAYFVYGYLVEGLLIRKDFSPYTAVYRSADSIAKYVPIGLVSTLLAVFVLATLYARGIAGGPGTLDAVRFGLLAGVFVALVDSLHNLVTLNIGIKLGIEITLSTVIQWTIVGVVISLIYKLPQPH